MNKAKTSKAPSRTVNSAVAVAAIAIAASAVLSAAVASPGGERPATAAAKKKGKKKANPLKKRLAALEARLAAVEARAPVPGPAGPTGAAGATNVVVRTQTSNIGAGANSSVFGKSCNAGERAVGGGVGFASPALGDRVAQSYPASAGSVSGDGQVPTGWLGAVFNGGATRNATVWVLCASP